MSDHEYATNELASPPLGGEQAAEKLFTGNLQAINELVLLEALHAFASKGDLLREMECNATKQDRKEPLTGGKTSTKNEVFHPSGTEMDKDSNFSESKAR